MNTIENSDIKPESTKAPEQKTAQMRVDTVSERAMRTCWMPIWRPVVESGNDQAKPSSY